MQSSEDAHDRDVSGLHTVIRMDEEAKYYLTREIADLHRRLERKESANRDLAQKNRTRIIRLRVTLHATRQKWVIELILHRTV